MEIASAAKTATLELKAYSAQLALELAEKQIREKLDRAQDELANAFVNDLRQEKSAQAGADSSHDRKLLLSDTPGRWRMRMLEPEAGMDPKQALAELRAFNNHFAIRELRNVLLSPAVSNTKNAPLCAS